MSDEQMAAVGAYLLMMDGRGFGLVLLVLFRTFAA
jgi:hypothetical protein